MLDTVSTLGAWGATNDIYMEMYKDTSKHIAEPTVVQMCVTAGPSIRDVNEKEIMEMNGHVTSSIMVKLIPNLN